MSEKFKSTPNDSRATLTDMPIAVKTETIRSNIEALTFINRKKEVEQRIINADKLDAEFLKNISMQISDGKILFIEYRYISCTNSYVYLDKDCNNFHYHSSKPKMVQFPLRHPGFTVLLKVFMDGNTEEIYRWDD